MAADALLGGYVANVSAIHRLDARVKLALLLASTIALFAGGVPSIVMLALACALASRLAGVSVRAIASGVRPAALILAFMLVANSFTLDGTGDVALVGTLGISIDGACRGALAVARVVVLVGLALVVTATTTPPQIAEALASLMSPLAGLGVPVADIAMTLSIALRFIPLTAEEFSRIRDAQRARGVDFAAGSVVERLRRTCSVLVPLVVALFRRADELAVAMQERSYRGDGRTRMSTRLRRADVTVLALGLAACLAVGLLA